MSLDTTRLFPEPGPFPPLLLGGNLDPLRAVVIILDLLAPSDAASDYACPSPCPSFVASYHYILGPRKSPCCAAPGPPGAHRRESGLTLIRLAGFFPPFGEVSGPKGGMLYGRAKQYLDGRAEELGHRDLHPYFLREAAQQGFRGSAGGFAQGLPGRDRKHRSGNRSPGFGLGWPWPGYRSRTRG